MDLMDQPNAKRQRAVRGFNSSLWRILLTGKALSALAAGILLSLPGQMQARVITAASAGLGDVTVAVLAAADGDTVGVPAGTANWTLPLTITKGITLQGAGIGQTIIIDSLPGTAPNPQCLLVFKTPANKSVRLTGFEFRPDPAGRTNTFGQGLLNCSGSSHAFRVDNCKFANVKNRTFYFSGAVFGVVDHCEFITSGINGMIYLMHDGLPGPNGENGSFGDGSWATPTNMGSADAIYFEDNTFTNPTSYHLTVTDGNGGARLVFRDNVVRNMYFEYHGTGSTGGTRSVRYAEYYRNTMTFSPATAAGAFHIRGGTGVCWGNTTIGYNASQWHTMKEYRDNESFAPWLGCNGLSGFDLNDTTGGPNGNGIYLSGTAGAGSSGQTLVITGASFTANQWLGYAVIDLDQIDPLGGLHTFGSVSASTSNSITVDPASHPEASVNWAVGHRFEIRRVVKAIDNIGNGPGDYLGGRNQQTGFPTSPRWLNQTNEPYYLWGNTVNGNSVGGVSSSAHVVAGVNFINAAKPGYTPLVHPHPLVGGASPGATPGAPQNLRVSGP
jgi:hypothetical protein